jgi:hypothetical protein
LIPAVTAIWTAAEKAGRASQVQETMRDFEFECWLGN